MAYKPPKGTYEIDRVFRGLGRVRLRTGTHEKRRAQQYELMLEDLPLETVRLIVDGILPLREAYDLWCRGETKLLPTAQLLRPLIATMREWATQYQHDVSPSELARRLGLATFFEQTHAGARVGELPAIFGAMRETYRTRGARFNRWKNVCMAFARDVLGMKSRTHEELSVIKKLPEPPKRRRHHCTVSEARAIALTLGDPWGPVWWAMCCSGMGPKEYFDDGWKVIEHGLEIRGQKQPARNRVVPYIVAPPKPPGDDRGLEWALVKADAGVSPYDARRTYTRWLDEVGLPGYRQDAYVGHGPKSMRELYKWGEIKSWLADDGAKLREYVGEPIALRVQA